ncbi:hypothetical protein PIB30_058889, partial [Stylosanthes scabra]|nr:hypothetical protein [Stylosanthes scabra]
FCALDGIPFSGPMSLPGSTLGEQASSMWRTCLNGITIGRWHPHWWSDGGRSPIPFTCLVGR